MPEMRNIITVTVLNRYVRTLLERDPVLTDVRLRGEISNFVHHRSGHCYFSLKDESCSVKAVMFRGDAQQLNFMPQNGMCIVADCRISLFERDGSFQVYVEHMFPDGLGSIRMAFEQLKERLGKEGLFAPEHKKPIPALPGVIGVVTSATGAALQDIRNVLTRRFPMAKLLLAPVNVQGAEAAPDIAAAIAQMDAAGLADVIIVARGGGSAEDLWVFNDERIARAAYRCETPLISAIGHEIDFTILDFVADLRAPTPSAAAELAAPDMRRLQGQNSVYAQKLQMLVAQKLQRGAEKQLQLRSHPALQKMQTLPVTEREKLVSAAKRAKQLTAAGLQTAAQQFAGATKLAAGLNPYAVLARGYAIVRQHGGGLQAETLRVGDTLTVETSALQIDCTVDAFKRKEQEQ